MLEVAGVLAQRATCRKLAVGCVLVDRGGQILSTGYNGTPRGMTHCTEVACGGAELPSGADRCEAVHAESNALLQCKDVDRIETCYVTYFPCLRCAKTLLNTACKRIVVRTMDIHEPAALALWLKAGRFYAVV